MLVMWVLICKQTGYNYTLQNMLNSQLVDSQYKCIARTVLSTKIYYQAYYKTNKGKLVCNENCVVS